MIRFFVKPILLALLMAFPWLAEGQIPAPQINLTGNVGTQGFPLLNSGTLILASDANHSMTAQETSAFSLKVTSSVSLTATRSLVMPSGRFSFGCIENATTGGQSIQIISTSGTGVPIATGTSVCGIWNDGTNYVTGVAGGGSSGISGLTTGFIPLAGTSTTITSSSHIDDGVTQSGRLTSSETMQFGTFNNGFVVAPGGSGSLQGWSSGGIQTWQILNSNGQAQFGPLFVQNGNTATSSANVNSPLSSIQGSYWNGSVPQVDTWAWQNVMGTGTNPASSLTLTHTGSSGTASINMPYAVTMNSLTTNGINTNGILSGGSTPAISTSGWDAAAINAISGTNNNSPPISSTATYFNSGSQNDVWTSTNVIGTGTNPSSVYTLSHSGATGGTSVSLPFAVTVGQLKTSAPCVSTASPAACGSSVAGSVVIAIGGNGNTINTTAVRAGSQIFITPDVTLGPALGITCDSNALITESIAVPNGRTPGAGFSFVTSGGTVATNPACYSYLIVN